MENTANKNLIYGLCMLGCGVWCFSGNKAKGYKPSAKSGGQGGRKVSVSNKKPSTSFRGCGGVECQSAYSGGLNRRANF